MEDKKFTQRDPEMSTTIPTSLERKQPPSHTYQSPVFQPKSSPKPTVENKTEKKEAKGKPTYVNVIEGHICRHTKESPYDGLSTSGIGSSAVYVVTGKRNGEACFSLIHANASTTPKQITDETDWLEGAELILIEHEQETKNTSRAVHKNLRSLQRKCSVKIFPKGFEAVCASLSDSGELELSYQDSKKTPPFNLINHPQALEIHSFHQFNLGTTGLHSVANLFNQMAINFRTQPFSFTELPPDIMFTCSPEQPLLFDGEKFTASRHKLLDQAKKMYEHLEKFFPQPQNLNLKKIADVILQKLTDEYPTFSQAEKTLFFNPIQLLAQSPMMGTSLTLSTTWFCYIKDPKTTVVEVETSNPGLQLYAASARRYSHNHTEVPVENFIINPLFFFAAPHLLDRKMVDRKEATSTTTSGPTTTRVQHTTSGFSQFKPTATDFKIFLPLAFVSYFLLKNEAHSTQFNVVKAFIVSGLICLAIRWSQGTNSSHQDDEPEVRDTPKPKRS